jgi:8-hydroxy-5-deazaflavin:NADPH oxidoreductase
MAIAILGAGNVGGTLGTAWAARGNHVVFGVREPGAAKVKALVSSSRRAPRRAQPP